MPAHLVIAIDGPAASGKGTLARLLAEKYDMAYLDTGLLYRAAAMRAVRAGIAPDDHEAAGRTARELADHLNWIDLADPELRSAAAGQNASIYSAIPSVRTALREIQRHFAATPPAHMNGRPCRGVILDGRDIGTAICPDAPIKFYVMASAEERARRRVAELQARGFAADYDAILMDLKERDARDQNRASDPLRPADDAQIIDTSHQSIDQVLAAASARVDAILSTD